VTGPFWKSLIMMYGLAVGARRVVACAGGVWGGSRGWCGAVITFELMVLQTRYQHDA